MPPKPPYLSAVFVAGWPFIPVHCTVILAFSRKWHITDDRVNKKDESLEFLKYQKTSQGPMKLMHHIFVA
jgi:hypothetical protein